MVNSEKKESKVTFTFRTDASLQMGTGHVMRCLTLAKALRERGASCHFICREQPGHLATLLQQTGFEVSMLADITHANAQSTTKNEPVLEHNNWLGATWQTDADQTIHALNGAQPDWLIVDHYALDERWENHLRPYCKKIMVIDDLADRKHDCDLLLDQNLVAEFESRYDSLVPSNCAKLLGPNYALLQPEYAELHPRTPPRLGPVQRILVYFGGFDSDNLTGRTISAFLELNRADIEVDVVINPGSPHADSVRAQIIGHSNITIHEQLPSLAHLMAKADMAIGAGGATSWERCCLGLPTIVITIAANQIPIASELDKLGLVRWLGCKETFTSQALKNTLLDNLNDEVHFVEWSARCRAMVNGKGTDKVADIMLLNADTALIARNAEIKDEALILKWANDPLVRRNAFSTSVIEPSTHRKWFYAHMRNPDLCQMYVIETDMGLPIGQVRFELKNGAWEIDFGLADFARRRQLGRPLLKTAIQKLRSERKGVQVFGRVKLDNLPSIHVFKDLGFDKVHEGGGLSISICSDAGSWLNAYIPELMTKWLMEGHTCTWVHDAKQLQIGDLCFFLSYGRMAGNEILKKFKNNLVVHESDLPKGKGWSPLTWQILEGKNEIPVTLIEASSQLDSGLIYAQRWMKLAGHELIDELRFEQAYYTINLCSWFVENYPESTTEGKPQIGVESFYQRRRPEHSILDLNKSLSEQFNLLRVVDNERYPAFFELNQQKYFIKIQKDK